MGVYVQRISLEKYRADEPGRLKQIDQGVFLSLHLLRRINKTAYRLIAVASDISYVDSGEQHFGLRYADEDLRLATTQPHMAQLLDGYWKPDQALPLRDGHIMNTEADIGYFTPYGSDLDAKWRLVSKALELTPTR